MRKGDRDRLDVALAIAEDLPRDALYDLHAGVARLASRRRLTDPDYLSRKRAGDADSRGRR